MLVPNRGFCGGVTVAALLPKSPPVEPNDTEAEDTFRLSNMLGALLWTGFVALCFGFDVGLVAKLNKGPSPVVELLLVEAGTCPVRPPFGQMVLDSENRFGAGWDFAVTGTELVELGASELGAVAGLVGDFEAVEGLEGLEGVTTGLDKGRTVWLLLAGPRDMCLSHTVGDSRLMLSACS